MNSLNIHIYMLNLRVFVVFILHTALFSLYCCIFILLTMNKIRAIMHSSITSQLREVKNEKESKIMKKVFALALTVLMVMSMFAGCGSSNTKIGRAHV